MEFKFEGRLKLVTQVLMAIGVVALVGGFLTDHSDHHQRFWANLLINGFFYFTMALAALFFYALQSVSYTHLRAPRDLSTSRMPSSA